MLPNPVEADDVVQEVFLTVTAKANDFETGTNFKAWVLTIARFKVLELYRKNKRVCALSDELLETLAEEMDDPDSHREAATLKALSHCVGKLAPRPRQMIELLYQHKMKPGEIAEELGWEANAVYVALSRARANLRKCIKHQIKSPLS